MTNPDAGPSLNMAIPLPVFSSDAWNFSQAETFSAVFVVAAKKQQNKRMRNVGSLKATQPVMRNKKQKKKEVNLEFQAYRRILKCATGSFEQKKGYYCDTARKKRWCPTSSLSEMSLTTRAISFYCQDVKILSI